MSRSKRWKSEWSFFLAANGRRTYNSLCRKCLMDCKQSFRAIIIYCPKYISKRSKKCRKKC